MDELPEIRPQSKMDIMNLVNEEITKSTWRAARIGRKYGFVMGYLAGGTFAWLVLAAVWHHWLLF